MSVRAATAVSVLLLCPFILVLLQAVSQRRKVGYESRVHVTEAMPTLPNRMRVREPLPQGRLQIAGSSPP